MFIYLYLFTYIPYVINELPANFTEFSIRCTDLPETFSTLVISGNLSLEEQQ